MKKLVALLLAATMMCTCVACGGNGEDAGNDGNAGNEGGAKVEITDATEVLTKAWEEYNKTATNKYILNDRFTSAYDIIPTLYDLLGVKFNQNLYIGHSLFSPSEYVYQVNGVYRDMFVYYSNTGGIFSRDVYTYNFVDYTTEIKVGDDVIQMFDAEAANVLRKINFMHIMNHYQLHDKLEWVYLK